MTKDKNQNAVKTSKIRSKKRLCQHSNGIRWKM